MRPNRVLIALILSISVITSAPAQTTSAEQEETPGGGKFFVPMLIQAATSSVASGIGGEASNLVGGYFRKFLHWVFGDPNKPDEVSNSPNAVLTAHSIQVEQAIVNTPMDQLRDLVPSLAVKIDKLDPSTYKVIEEMPDIQSAPPIFRTGEVFSIRFVSNLPGVIQLENIDSTGTRVDLNKYFVEPLGVNRVPPDGGIRMEGTPGQETLKVRFTPCRPAPLQRKPSIAKFEQLPVCNETTNVMMAGAKSGRVAAKAMRVERTSDPSALVAGVIDYTPQDAAKGLPTEFDVRVLHQPTGSSITPIQGL